MSYRIPGIKKHLIATVVFLILMSAGWFRPAAHAQVETRSRIFNLQHGSIRAHGAPIDVLRVQLIEDVYGVKATVGEHPLTGKLHVFVDARSAPV